jgi:hypothetical protein
MDTISTALNLLRREAEIRNAMRRPGGIRVTEERELLELRQALARYPAAVSAILEAADRMRRPVDTLSAGDVENLSVISAH